jgi:hypothetical protein
MFSRENETVKVGRCPSCNHVIGSEKVCSCGKATPNMSFAERTEYEVQQWKAYKARAVASV